MNGFKNKITLSKNGRGCWIIDTVKGCSGCNKERPRGCYGDCYAWNIAARYGRDFSRIVKRDFDRNQNQLYFPDFVDEEHLSKIIKEIKRIDMPFVRIGELGDPSEDWAHTINICGAIQAAGKPIVIITKHWKTIPETLLPDIRMLNICINTSISALDNDTEISHRIEQYNRLKKYCNSVLRIVSCDFSRNSFEGERMGKIQEKLFENDKVIDTVFRPSKSNKLVTTGVINTKKIKFLKQNMLASQYNIGAYLGRCETCPDMCGVNL